MRSTTVAAELDWLMDQTGRHSEWMPPGVDRATAEAWFDYAAEDTWLHTAER